jgi:hypothetical protein
MLNITKLATCSADRTVRFWNFVDPTSQINSSSLNKLLTRNAYCKDMSRMIYVSNYDSRDTGSSLNALPFEWFKAKPITLNEDGTPK